MAMRIGESVRMRQGAEVARLLGEAAKATGIIGDTWTDDRGERVSYVYQDAQVYAYGVAAADLESAATDARPSRTCVRVLEKRDVESM